MFVYFIFTYDQSIHKLEYISYIATNGMKLTNN